MYLIQVILPVLSACIEIVLTKPGSSLAGKVCMCAGIYILQNTMVVMGGWENGRSGNKKFKIMV